MLPILTQAQGYSPLVGIPGVDPNVNDFDTYINTLYALSISIAALLAVIKIVIAGVKWMMTDVVTSKSEAKKDIQGALLGLLIVLGAVLIITVINPDILDVNLNLDKASTQTSSGTSGTSPAGAAAIPLFTTNPNGNDQVVVIPPTLKSRCENIDANLCSADPYGIDCKKNEYYPSGDTFVCIIRDNP